MYELWETRSGNLVGAYETYAEALDVVRQAAEKHGSWAVRSLSLEEADGEGAGQLLASGSYLESIACSDGPTRQAAAG